MVDPPAPSPSTSAWDERGPGIVLTAGPTPQDWRAAGRGFEQLEELGSTAIWLTDHLFWGRPMPEALTLAAVAADRTRGCVVGTGVLQLPMRSVPVVAKEAATVHLLSGGRFVLGVGIGEHRREYELAGAPFAARGRTLDRCLAELGRLWTEQPADDEWFAQRPVPGPIPIWLGGRSAAAIARVAAVGDGWMPIFVTAEQFGRGVAELDEALAVRGRPAGSVVRAVTVLAAVADGPAAEQAARTWCSRLWDLPDRVLAPYLVVGPPARVAEALDAYRQAGAEHVSVLLATDDPVGAYAELAAVPGG